MNFRRITALIAFLYIFNLGFSQNVIGPRALSLGGNSILLTDANSVTSNPGIISELKEIQLATSYAIPYLVNEFQQQGVVGVVPLKKGGISFGGQFTGKELFRQQKISLSYGLKLNDKFSIGIGLNHQQIRIQNYNPQFVLTADVGLYSKINDKLNLAVSILSFGGNHSNSNQERFPTAMQIGLKYLFNKQLQTYFSIDKNTNLKPNYRIGIEYEAYKNLSFRTGTVLNSKILAFGIGYELPMRLRIDIGSQWQQLLGWTPHLGFLYRFSPK